LDSGSWDWAGNERPDINIANKRIIVIRKKDFDFILPPIKNDENILIKNHLHCNQGLRFSSNCDNL